MKPGRAGTMTHDYKRHGTIDLFAAVNQATGEVLTGLAKRYAAADVLRFFRQIDATVPHGLAVHVGRCSGRGAPHAPGRSALRSGTFAPDVVVAEGGCIETRAKRRSRMHWRSRTSPCTTPTSSWTAPRSSLEGSTQ